MIHIDTDTPVSYGIHLCNHEAVELSFSPKVGSACATVWSAWAREVPRTSPANGHLTIIPFHVRIPIISIG